MLLISEYNPTNLKQAGEDYLRKLEYAAKLQGIPIVSLNRHSKGEIGEKLDYLQKKYQDEVGIWLGFVPSFAAYKSVYQQLIKRGIRLINSPEEFRRAEYFDEFYPFIKEETIESEIATTIEMAKKKAVKLSYPIFIKGAIQSLKKLGWNNCIAQNETELESIWNLLQANQAYSLNKAILRKLVKFEYKEVGGNGIPQSHEYRYLVFNQEIIGKSNYWSPNQHWLLSPKEELEIASMVKMVSKKVAVPYISVDVGKLKSGEWKVIEIGDGQFSDIRDISAIKLWNWLKEKVEK